MSSAWRRNGGVADDDGRTYLSYVVVVVAVGVVASISALIASRRWTSDATKDDETTTTTNAAPVARRRRRRGATKISEGRRRRLRRKDDRRDEGRRTTDRTVVAAPPLRRGTASRSRRDSRAFAERCATLVDANNVRGEFGMERADATEFCGVAAEWARRAFSTSTPSVVRAVLEVDHGPSADVFRVADEERSKSNTAVRFAGPRRAADDALVDDLTWLARRRRVEDDVAAIVVVTSDRELQERCRRAIAKVREDGDENERRPPPRLEIVESSVLASCLEKENAWSRYRSDPTRHGRGLFHRYDNDDDNEARTRSRAPPNAPESTKHRVRQADLLYWSLRRDEEDRKSRTRNDDITTKTTTTETQSWLRRLVGRPPSPSSSLCWFEDFAEHVRATNTEPNVRS